MLERYRVPPKRAFREMGLGVPVDGHVRVVAGFRFKWWVPDFAGPIEPIIVNARILRLKANVKKDEVKK